MKLFLTRLLIGLLSVSIEGFNFYKYNFNVNIKKGLDSSIINFIRIHNVNFIRIRENPKYLILRYLHEPIEDIIGNNDNNNNQKKNNKKLIVLKDNKNFIKVIDNSYSNNYNKDKGVIINDVRTDNYNYYYHYDYSNSDDYENYNNMMDEENEKSYLNNNYDIYELIKNNKKPIIISYEKKKEELKIEKEKIAKKIIYITPQHIEITKKLFELFGVTYVTSPTEAEVLLSVMCKNNYIDAIISEDMDVLPTGGHLFLKGFNSDKNEVDEYCLEGILNCLEMNQNQFIDLCILCGSDYTSKIDRMGPMTAYKLIKKYGNLENIIEERGKTGSRFKIPNQFDYQKARELFISPIEMGHVEYLRTKIDIKKQDVEKLIDFLSETSIKEKFLKDIDKNLINYYMNIENMRENE